MSGRWGRSRYRRHHQRGELLDGGSSPQQRRRLTCSSLSARQEMVALQRCFVSKRRVMSSGFKRWECALTLSLKGALRLGRCGNVACALEHRDGFLRAALDRQVIVVPGEF